MSDQETPVTPAETATPQTPEPTTTPQGQVTEEKQEPTFVTREELAQRDAELERRIRQADKQRAKAIKQEVNTLKESLTAAGIQVTPQQEEVLAQKVADKIYNQDEPDETSATVDVPLSEQPQEVQDAVNLMAYRNFILKPGVPEYDQILKPILDSGDLRGLVQATDRAIDLAKARINSQKESAQLRTPSGGGRPPGEVAKSASEYWGKAYKK